MRKVAPPSFSVQRKNTMFSGKKIPPFQVVQERSCPGAILFEKTIFSEHIIFPCIFFFEKDHLSFSVWGKIIFSGKRNIILPDNTRKIKFQHDFFGKAIFSGRLEKEDMVMIELFPKMKKWLLPFNSVSKTLHHIYAKDS